MTLVHKARASMSYWKRTAVVATAACILLASVPSAAQVNAPSWWGNSDNDTISLGFLFPQSNWPPTPDFAVTPAWYEGTTWTRTGTMTPTWTGSLSGHTGVWGLTTGFPGQVEITVRLDNDHRPGWIKHVWFQYDVYQVGAVTCCLYSAGNVGTIINEQQTIEELPFGWQRVTGSFDVIPQPDWEEFTWQFDVEASGKAAIDNIYIGTHCEPVPEPAPIVALASSILALVAARRRR